MREYFYRKYLVWIKFAEILGHFCSQLEFFDKQLEWVFFFNQQIFLLNEVSQTEVFKNQDRGMTVPHLIGLKEYHDTTNMFITTWHLQNVILKTRHIGLISKNMTDRYVMFW